MHTKPLNTQVSQNPGNSNSWMGGGSCVKAMFDNPPKKFVCREYSSGSAFSAAGWEITSSRSCPTSKYLPLSVSFATPAANATQTMPFRYGESL